MAIFPNVYVAMVMISSMGIISMSMSYCPYALLGQYHEIKEVHMFNFGFLHDSCKHMTPVNVIVKYSFLQYIQHSPGNSKRGFGIDCAILSCQVCVINKKNVPCIYCICTVNAHSCVSAIVEFVRYFCIAGVHQSDHGGLGSGRCGRSGWQCSRHSHGGLWGLPAGFFHCLLLGHLPCSKQQVSNLSFY